MFSGALAISASIPTLALTFGHGLALALLALLVIGAAGLLHEALSTRHPTAVSDPESRPVCRTAPARPIPQPATRPLAA